MAVYRTSPGVSEPVKQEIIVSVAKIVHNKLYVGTYVRKIKSDCLRYA